MRDATTSADGARGASCDSDTGGKESGGVDRGDDVHRGRGPFLRRSGFAASPQSHPWDLNPRPALYESAALPLS